MTPAPSPTPIPTQEPIAATSATFSLLPAEPPADFLNTITCDDDIGPSDSVAIVRMASGDEDVLSRGSSAATPTSRRRERFAPSDLETSRSGTSSTHAIFSCR